MLAIQSRGESKVKWPGVTERNGCLRKSLLALFDLTLQAALALVRLDTACGHYAYSVVTSN